MCRLADPLTTTPSHGYEEDVLSAEYSLLTAGLGNEQDDVWPIIRRYPLLLKFTLLQTVARSEQRRDTVDHRKQPFLLSPYTTDLLGVLTGALTPLHVLLQSRHISLIDLI
jgi:hypothetical protein